MYFSTPLVAILAAASTAEAFDVSSEVTTAASNGKRSLGKIIQTVNTAVSSLFQRQGSCPAVWSEISTTLTAQFLADGQCTDAARAAIRAAFHDCVSFTKCMHLTVGLTRKKFNGACDGSLILADECSNSENAGLTRLCGNLATVAKDNNVGVADLIQFAAGTYSS